MEPQNNKIINGFVSESEIRDVISFSNSLAYQISVSNTHILSVRSAMNGSSHMFDISETDISKKISSFQSDKNISDVILPEIFHTIQDRICDAINISNTNSFLQIISQKPGGKIVPHYDSSVKGYINYKCNVCIYGNDYKLYFGNDYMDVKAGDLYCFEASLYKHWTDEMKSDRIILSYGFLIPYNALGRSENDPRIRLSNRIIKYFQ